MTTRYYALTECEHGNIESHQTYIKDRRGNIGAEGPVCPGGSRRELEDVEIVDFNIPLIVGGFDPEDWQIELPPGRYAIIPLSGDPQ